jgi:hypothetical protein
MSEHTPGPWTVDRLCIQAPDGNVALVNLARASDADARLIAAAPDLLEAAKAMTEPAGEIAYRERWMALKAAIAKAEGR